MRKEVLKEALLKSADHCFIGVEVLRGSKRSWSKSPNWVERVTGSRCCVKSRVEV